MSVTATEVETLKKALTQADPNKIADALRRIALGDILDVKEETIAVAPAAAAVDLEALSAAKKGALMVQSVEVLAVGTAALGSRRVVPSTDAATATEVVLSVDGKTLTFEGTVTSVRVRWIAAPAVALSTKFAPTS